LGRRLALDRGEPPQTLRSPRLHTAGGTVQAPPGAPDGDNEPAGSLFGPLRKLKHILQSTGTERPRSHPLIGFAWGERKGRPSWPGADCHADRSPRRRRTTAGVHPAGHHPRRHPRIPRRDGRERHPSRNGRGADKSGFEPDRHGQHARRRQHPQLSLCQGQRTRAAPDRTNELWHHSACAR
jgi:hypothetical protein